MNTASFLQVYTEHIARVQVKDPPPSNILYKAFALFHNSQCFTKRYNSLTLCDNRNKKKTLSYK